MSNTKWRIVFQVLRDAGVRHVIVKFADAADTVSMLVPNLRTPHAFVDSAEFGPLPLVGIEWVEVASDATPILAALEATGKQFPVETTATGLRIVGHTR